MSNTAPGYRNLKVWQRACDLALRVYEVTASFPREEMYGLTSQMRRCGVSIPANIAEGRARGSDADMARFLHISLGSLAELETLVHLAERLGYLDRDQARRLEDEASEVGRMLNGLVARLRGD